jgi:hypothetical protein
MTDAQAPNSRYDAGCVKKYGWDTAISSMNLARPSLGNLHGDINYPATSSYKIKAVGNLFGGMIYNLLDSGNSSTTGIYGFHQPNDLIVPYQINRKVFHGLNACAYAVCNQSIINRPNVYSSPTIRDWAATASVDFHFDSTKNTTDCGGQIANPSQGGHQLDNWSRTWNMATYFASKIDTSDCELTQINEFTEHAFQIYPNPATSSLVIKSELIINQILIYNTTGNEVYHNPSVKSIEVSIHNINLASGVYFVYIRTKNGIVSQKLVILSH